MNYLLDKRNKNKKYAYTALAFIFLFILIYFKSGIFSGFSSGTSTIFHPFITAGNNIGDKFKGLGTYFTSKGSLSKENEKLQAELDQEKAQMSNYDSVLADNIGLKEVLGRKNEKTPMILAGILSKPNQSIYDTLIIDAGTKQGVAAGDKVFALGDIPIGRVDLVYVNSAKVILYSNSGEKTQVVVGNKNIYMEAVGRGGGNFEMILPRDFVVQKGDEAVLPGINPYVVATVETTISDLRDPFQKALLISPVNIQEIKFVEVEK